MGAGSQQRGKHPVAPARTALGTHLLQLHCDARPLSACALHLRSPSHLLPPVPRLTFVEPAMPTHNAHTSDDLPVPAMVPNKQLSEAGLNVTALGPGTLASVQSVAMPALLHPTHHAHHRKDESKDDSLLSSMRCTLHRYSPEQHAKGRLACGA